MNIQLLAATAATTTAGTTGSKSILMILYVVMLAGCMYFMVIKPRKKQEKQQKELMASMAIGDSVMTTAGFYGVIIDLTEDTAIVEFGNNKNCRIPMQKAAIIQVEKPGSVE